MKLKKQFKIMFLQALIGGLFVSCDSGDIYPENKMERNDNITVTANFILSGNADTENYQLYFAAFEENNALPIVWTKVAKEDDGTTVNVTLDNVPPQADSVRLCLLSIGRRAIYSFASYGIDKANGNIEIPLENISLKMNYYKIQNIYERNTCTACHGTESGGAGLLLGAGKSYENLVNHPATNSPKMRVEPFHIENSFLIEALTSDTSSLRHPHHTMMHNQDDLNLLKAWIERGSER
ncbi:MAG: hypothetical protein LBS52_03880 [Dysgonamonadaceae bacterium]|jgi:hypothetical protein|nr:hypothetical protein [Dysgonamonadaceae bacterium]